VLDSTDPRGYICVCPCGVTGCLCDISAPEIEFDPATTKQTSTLNDDVPSFGSQNSVDGDLTTQSCTKTGEYHPYWSVEVSEGVKICAVQVTFVNSNTAPTVVRLSDVCTPASNDAYNFKDCFPSPVVLPGVDSKIFVVTCPTDIPSTYRHLQLIRQSSGAQLELREVKAVAVPDRTCPGDY
jgi:hypothetical protein